MASNCVNYELCQNYKTRNHDFCIDCGTQFKFGFGWNKLTIFDSTEECAVCMETTGRKMMFPAKCGHSFCVDCSRDILLWDGRRYYLSPIPYGCLPCPKGCNNPLKGRQCECTAYEIVKEEWGTANPANFSKWIEAENKSILSAADCVYGQCTCPLCRRKYVKI